MSKVRSTEVVPLGLVQQIKDFEGYFLQLRIKGGVLGYFSLFRLLNLMSARHAVDH